MINNIKKWAKNLKYNLYALYLACQHKDVPVIGKIISIIVVSYALSPIDLIPDFIPILGYLDDMILLPIGIIIAIKLIPKNIWIECKNRAYTLEFKSLPNSKIAALIVVIIWILLIKICFFS